MTANGAYFEARHPLMAASRSAGAAALCYDQQVAAFEASLTPGSTVLDVGCGPRLPYRSAGVYVIGLDPSAASLEANTDVDERIVGSATAIPLPDAWVDVVVAWYSVHHMTTQTFGGSRLRAEAALREMQRVVRPGGRVVVFEMSPQPLAWGLEQRVWDVAKACLSDRLDACFWPAELYTRALPGCTVTTFTTGAWTWLPPAFSLPWLKLPRWLYPLDAARYEWVRPG